MAIADTKQKRSDLIFLSSALLLALVLRLYNLGADSIWLDEAISYDQVKLPFEAMIAELTTDVHPPVYYVILNFTVHVFGSSEFLLRLPSVLFGWLSVVLVYPVASMLCDRRTALYATLLGAISLLWINYSQEVRMYSLASCMALLSMYAFLRLCRRDRSAWDTVFYVLATTLLLYTHVFGAFVVIAQNLYVFSLVVIRRYFEPFSLKQWVVMQLACLVLFLPWVQVLLGQVTRVQKGFWIGVPDLSTLLETGAAYAGPLLVFLISVPLLAIALIIGKRQDAEFEVKSTIVSSRYFLLLWLLVPVLLPFVISLLSQPIYHYRYTIVASPAWYILVALGLSSIPLRWLRLSVLLLLVGLLVYRVPGYYQSKRKPNWRDIVAHVEQAAEVDDLVLFNQSNLIQPFSYYSSRNDIKKYPVARKRDTFVAEQDASKLPEVVSMVAAYDGVWMVLGYTQFAEFSEDQLLQVMEPDYELIDTRVFPRIRVLHFERKL
jgi:mannosyltransferase